MKAIKVFLTGLFALTLVGSVTHEGFAQGITTGPPVTDRGREVSVYRVSGDGEITTDSEEPAPVWFEGTCRVRGDGKVNIEILFGSACSGELLGLGMDAEANAAGIVFGGPGRLFIKQKSDFLYYGERPHDIWVNGSLKGKTFGVTFENVAIGGEFSGEATRVGLAIDDDEYEKTPYIGMSSSKPVPGQPTTWGQIKSLLK